MHHTQPQPSRVPPPGAGHPIPEPDRFHAPVRLTDIAMRDPRAARGLTMRAGK